MIIGFTGTRKGLTETQKANIRMLLKITNARAFHHGDCIGADSEANDIALSLKIPIWIHPPIDGKYRAYKNDGFIHEPRDYIRRNHDIVDCSDYLIAAPKSMKEEIRSGTWATIRYARKINKPLAIVTDVIQIEKGPIF